MHVLRLAMAHMSSPQMPWTAAARHVQCPQTLSPSPAVTRSGTGEQERFPPSQIYPVPDLPGPRSTRSQIYAVPDLPGPRSTRSQIYAVPDLRGPRSTRSQIYAVPDLPGP
ncbi:unnamed protein product [Boreogadus saida]